MSLRALGFNLSRRFSPRWIPRVQAVSSPRIVPQAASVSSSGSGRPARALHTVRDLEIPGVGPAAGVAIIGLVGILFFKERTDGTAGDVTDPDEEVPAKKLDNPEDGLRLRGAKISWEEQEMAIRHKLLDPNKVVASCNGPRRSQESVTSGQDGK